MNAIPTREEQIADQLKKLEGMTQEQAVKLFDAFIRERDDIDPQDYGVHPSNDYRTNAECWKAWRSDKKDSSAYKKRALKALESFKGLPFEAATLASCLTSSFSGRLEILREDNPTRWALSYTAGQYYPTEYRHAAAVVLEDYQRYMMRAMVQAYEQLN